MSWPAIRWAKEQKVWNASERAVLCTLAHYARKQDGRAWPSLQTLAEECGMCERAVYSTIRRLAANGLLVIEGHLQRRKYRLCLEAGNRVAGKKEPEAEAGEAGNDLPEAGNRFRQAGNHCRRSCKDPNHNHQRGAPAGAVAAAAGFSGEPWAARLQGYRDSGFWYADWGPPPGASGCRAPGKVLELSRPR